VIPGPGTPRTRVVFVINDLARAGAETQLVALARALDRETHDIRIVIVKERNDFANELRAARIPVVALRRRGWWDALVLWRLYRELRRSRPDVVHSFLFLANLLATVAGRAARVPAIVLSQRCSYDATLPPVLRRAARWCHHRADRVIVNSAAACREEAAGGVLRTRLVHIPNGIGALDPPGVGRAALGLPDGPLALAVGQLERIKGHHVLLRAWPTVRRAVPDASLVLVGDGRRRLDLERQARRLGVADSVRFLGFCCPATPHLAACDVLVQPSLTEGMPNVVLEAMALGRPVVATRVGGSIELIEEGETGLLVPPVDADALAGALASLLVDPDRRAALGAAGRRRAREQFSIEAVAARTAALYHEIEAHGPEGTRRRRSVDL
jgi:glycosyltransferase involved in cell wall biosynthesis